MQRNTKRLSLTVMTLALGSAFSGIAFADTTVYDFSYVGSGPTSISGTLTVENTPTGNGYLIDSINAHATYSDGSSYSITSLDAVKSYDNNDNLLLLASPGVPGSGFHLDGYGFSFDNGTFQTNLYVSNSTYREVNNGTPFSDTGTFTLTADTSAVPEPSSLAMLGLAGLMVVGHVVRKRRAR